MAHHRCPRCGSSKVHGGKYGSLFTYTCLECDLYEDFSAEEPGFSVWSSTWSTHDPAAEGTPAPRLSRPAAHPTSMPKPPPREELVDHPQPQWPDDHAERDRAILADPDDDAPRWALARHMQARGEPRGEFIAIQLEMAEIRRSGDRDVRAWASHFDRAKGLLDRHSAWWLPPLPDFARNPIFVRGFVEYVEVDAEPFLSRADELYRVAPIRSLRAVGVAACVDRFFASPHLRRLFALDLWANHLGDSGLRVLCASPHLDKLRWLDIRQNNLTKVSHKTLRRSRISKNLRYVSTDSGYQGLDPDYRVRSCDPPWLRAELLHENAFPPQPEDVDDIAHR